MIPPKGLAEMSVYRCEEGGKVREEIKEMRAGWKKEQKRACLVS
jgi:hypothetical protein